MRPEGHRSMSRPFTASHQSQPHRTPEYASPLCDWSKYGPCQQFASRGWGTDGLGPLQGPPHPHSKRSCSSVFSQECNNSLMSDSEMPLRKKSKTCVYKTIDEPLSRGTPAKLLNPLGFPTALPHPLMTGGLRIKTRDGRIVTSCHVD